MYSLNNRFKGNSPNRMRLWIKKDFRMADIQGVSLFLNKPKLKFSATNTFFVLYKGKSQCHAFQGRFSAKYFLKPLCDKLIKAIDN